MFTSTFTEKNKIGSGILHAVADFLFLMILIVAVPLALFVDCRMSGHGIREASITEISQETLILLAAVLFWREARRSPSSRGFLILAGGFFACMFIRELDFVFDEVCHGFWLCPAILTALASVAVALAYRQTILSSMADFFASRSSVYVSIGLLIVFVFSRLFGSHWLWGEAMGADYKSDYKSIIQEGLELFGYGFIFFGAHLLRRE